MQTDQHVRLHGTPPCRIVIAHGGPGAAGEVEPLANQIAGRGHSVLEPFQTRRTVAGQVAELADQITVSCEGPVTLIGWSWGAWLCILLAEAWPDLVKKLILIGSGPFEAQYAQTIKDTRAARLSDAENAELSDLKAQSPTQETTARFLALYDKCDSYDHDGSPPPEIDLDMGLSQAVWKEGAALREAGALLRSLAVVSCPVVAIHGDHDPHPADGVAAPLRKALSQADFILLERCGHKPWIEKQAKAAFWATLMRHLVD